MAPGLDGPHPGRRSCLAVARVLLPVILLLALVAGLASFDSGGPAAEFTVVQANDAFTLDPQRMSWQHDIRLGRSIYENLVVVDPASGGVRPGVAERWEVSPDGLRWTFHLRAGARWSNGDPVTAADFVAGWRRAMVPDMASDYAGFVAEIAGAAELWKFRTAQLADFAALAAAERTEERARAAWDEASAFADRIVGARAVDDRTVEITLRRRVPYWLSVLAFPVMAPVHRATEERFASFDAGSGLRRVAPEWTHPGNLVCNGPFTVEEWRYRRRMRLVRNPFHWDPDATGVRTLDIVPIEDNNTAVLAFEGGGVDWLADVRVGYQVEMAEQASRWLARHRARFDELRASGMGVDEALAALPAPGPGERRDIHVIPNFGTNFYSFNCRPTLPGGRPNPFADARVRRAFALAVDKRSLAERVIRIGEPVAGSLVPPGGVPGYEPPAGIGHDVARAREEFRAAGWEDRDGDGVPESEDGTPFPVVEVLYSTASPRYRDLSLAMADMWRSSLGVQVELVSKDSKFLKDDLRSGNFMIARGGWYGDYDDPTTFLDLCRTGDGNNDRGYSNPAFDALLDRAAAEPDPARRLVILREAERIVTDVDLPILPLTHYVTVLMYDPARVRGVTRDPSFDQRLSDLRAVGR